MTPGQRALLDHLWAKQLARDPVPSYQELVVHLGLKSKSGIGRLLDGLEGAGYVRRTYPQRARSIEVLRPADAGGLSPAEWRWCVEHPDMVRAAMAAAP